ncbi:MAG TPA: Cof-type HAD-IIB family hydrolase [Limnochordia bacterium]|nr:Cof-type HAD-IIB family hydrolase [Limnochordia bacterium]HOQ74911.1 Cof-type HAD-IIB family hydrolase [Limnochordia bacterium]HPT36617.1 Cof-type HAD-IIB family hydrolase [Bacillota bacterium]
MAVRYRVLALDLDGTTLNAQGRVSRKTRYWLRKAAEAGVTLICATGRGYPRAKEIWETAFPGSPAVLANGAEIWLNPETLLERYYMEREDVLRLHRLAEETGGSFWAYNTTGMVRGHQLKGEDLGDGWYKCGIYHADRATVEELWRIVGSWENVSVTTSHPLMLEVAAKGISKRSGVERLCRELGVPMKEVMAVGDSLNDVELLQGVGLGVAMGNAGSEVKKAADRVTRSHRANGVAWAIRKYLLY